MSGRKITLAQAREVALGVQREAEEVRLQAQRRVCDICQIEHGNENCSEFVDQLITEMGGLMNTIRALEGWQAEARALILALYTEGLPHLCWPPALRARVIALRGEETR